MNYYSGHPDQHFGQITYSQHGEDMVILNIFAQLGIDKPSYLDLGAHHPSRISNTKLLYERGSRGVNIEANRHLIEAFYEQRPLDKNIHTGVSVVDGEAILYMFDDFSGRNTLSFNEVEYCKKTIGMEIRGHETVRTKTLMQIVKEYCDGHFPEFLNCDIEGLDYDILSSADFVTSSPVLVCVECRDPKKMCEMMLTKKFYPYVQMGENLLFLRDIYHYTLSKSWPQVPFPRQ